MGRDSEVQRGSAGPQIRVRRLRLVCRGAGGCRRVALGRAVRWAGRAAPPRRGRGEKQGI